MKYDVFGYVFAISTVSGATFAAHCLPTTTRCSAPRNQLFHCTWSGTSQETADGTSEFSSGARLKMATRVAAILTHLTIQNRCLHVAGVEGAAAGDLGVTSTYM